MSPLKYQDANRSIIFKWFYSKYDMMAWTGFIWLRIDCELLETQY